MCQTFSTNKSFDFVYFIINALHIDIHVDVFFILNMRSNFECSEKCLDVSVVCFVFLQLSC